MLEPNTRIHRDFIKKLPKQKQLITFLSIVYTFIYIYHNFQISYTLLTRPNLKEHKFSTNQTKVYQSLFHLQLGNIHYSFGTWVPEFARILIRKLQKQKQLFLHYFNFLQFFYIFIHSFAITLKFLTRHNLKSPNFQQTKTKVVFLLHHSSTLQQHFYYRFALKPNTRIHRNLIRDSGCA